MVNELKAEGVTPSERYLSKLCRRSFLSLWSHSNLHTDRGQKKGVGLGKELCDLLVVFGDDVIIFSDKHIEFNRFIEVDIAWKRWFRRAIHDSARQLYGADRWLRKYKDRIYLDSHCRKPFPISLPTRDRIKIHRIVVARGIYDACRDYFGGNSIGSLMINSDLVGNAHNLMPFNIGHVNPDKGFIHVFEDFTLDAVLGELDTVSDFIAYITKREQFLSKGKPVVTAPGDEQLLAIYLTKTNEKGEHDFVLPGEGIPDFVALDESFWDSMVENPQYAAKKNADKISYAWDELIEHFIRDGSGCDFSGENPSCEPNFEQALRFMASEPRVRRRQLANGLVDLLKSTPNDMRSSRLIFSPDFPEKAYFFLVFPFLEDMEYQEYLEVRKNLLSAYCKVAKLKVPKASYIIGFASGRGPEGITEHLTALDARDWTPARQEEAERLQREYELLLDGKIKKTEGRTLEWPAVEKTLVDKPQGSGLNRKQRRAAEKKRRRRKKK